VNEVTESLTAVSGGGGGVERS